MIAPDFTDSATRRRVAFFLLLGLFLSFRGYRSLEGDQAYRLPILLHRQDPSLLAADPFVAAFAEFNPHRGYLALLDGSSRVVGLSAALAVWFGLVFWATCRGVDASARAVWPEEPASVGLAAVVLVLVAQAGNVGTNHLFEPMLLDRQIGFALGWLAIAWSLARPSSGRWAAPALLGLAALVHPSVGLQLAMLLGAGRLGWLAVERPGAAATRAELRAIAGLAGAVVPGYLLNLGGGGVLLKGLSPNDFRLLAAYLQGPQHMLPHLWRMPQWLAWGCYPVLAALSLATAGGPMPGPRRRLAVLVGVTLVGLTGAWFGIERLENLPLTLFQPFRMATVARGLCLILMAGHLVRLWTTGRARERTRAALLVVGLLGDWRLVVVTLFEVAMSVADRRSAARWGRLAAWGVLAGGLVFLARHDTESGHWSLLATLGVMLAAGARLPVGPIPWTWPRVGLRMTLAWALPVMALSANVAAVESGRPPRRGFGWFLIHHCRFAAVPLDDVERLAVWCAGNTPRDARFVGPPGPKGFRLWAARSLAFNRAGSPYQASALADWAARYRAHVGFEGTNAEFVAAYLRNRQELDRGFDRMNAEALARLAARQGAEYVIAGARNEEITAASALERVHAEGRYAVYRVRANAVAQGPASAAIRR